MRSEHRVVAIFFVLMFGSMAVAAIAEAFRSDPKLVGFELCLRHHKPSECKAFAP